LGIFLIGWSNAVPLLSLLSLSVWLNNAARWVPFKDSSLFGPNNTVGFLLEKRREEKRRDELIA
jgi:hypothetical protein